MESNAELPQVPSALTKYQVVAEGVTVLDVSAVPVLLVYHFQEAPVPSDPPDVVSVVEPPGQTLVGFAVTPVAAVDELLKPTIIFLKAVLPQAPSART